MWWWNRVSVVGSRFPVVRSYRETSANCGTMKGVKNMSKKIKIALISAPIVLISIVIRLQFMDSDQKECRAKMDIFEEYVQSAEFTVEEADRLLWMVQGCSSSIYSKIIAVAKDSEPNEKTFGERLAMLVVYRSARKAKSDPELYIVTHHDESPWMEDWFKTKCVGFIHPETGRENSEWCYNNRTLMRKVFLSSASFTHRGKKHPPYDLPIHNYRTCLITNGGIGAEDGLIEDQEVHWSDAHDCLVKFEKAIPAVAEINRRNDEDLRKLIATADAKRAKKKVAADHRGIAIYCEREWGQDYEMQQFCREEQTEAYEFLQR